MVYNFFKKIGLTIALLMFSSAVVMIVVYLIIGFIESIIDWIETLQTIEGNITLHVASITIVIIFTFGVLLYIFGELYEFGFGKFPSILLETQDYKLTTEDIEKISVIIPAYNEEITIKKAIEKVKPFCKNVIVVNDGSEDKTGEIALKNGAIIVEHKLNKGLGQSLRDGIRRALALDSEIIINFDADLQYRAEEIPELVYYIIHEDYDLMMGSRLEGTIEKMSKFKTFGNKMYTKLLRYLTKVGVSDGQTGFRAFTNDFAALIKIRGDFTYTQEMILEATTKKAKIGEVPIHFDIRKDG
ncbi:MAG: glycosyltransferase family 2 protein, partial [Candidatus Heimdallarchaeota archaeon]|nr:glycosyltransferase family 2 protein [Candidatus Heimdallarchaeota archaeon]MCK4877237.1 glycosyltransferase family 2 protein [Candidatus Heimdallarchaeota archaeon]